MLAESNATTSSSHGDAFPIQVEERFEFVNSSRDHRIGPAKTFDLAGLSLAASLCLASCGGSDDDRPLTYETTGVVAYKGKLLADAVVAYKCIGDPVPIAYGTTDAEGLFRSLSLKRVTERWRVNTANSAIQLMS